MPMSFFLCVSVRLELFRQIDKIFLSGCLYRMSLRGASGFYDDGIQESRGITLN